MLTIAHYQQHYSIRALAMKNTSALLQRNPNISMNVRSDSESSRQYNREHHHHPGWH
jgi:hypothetical protein